MKLFYALIILFFLNSCSFDKKTGIWKNSENISDNKDIKKNDQLKDFKTLMTSTELFNEVIPINDKFKFQLSKPINNSRWSDIFFQHNNSSKNFKFNGSSELIFKSKKITKFKSNNYILYKENHILISDVRGNISVFSIKENKVIKKFNFYKKKYKDLDKSINFILDKNTIYVSDNIGYLYAYDLEKNKILWANNFKIPFRSNLKITKNKLILSNQNNSVFFIDKLSGKMLKMIPTEEISLKNQFSNSLSLNKEQNLLFFLNTYGSLYSINTNSMSVNWFINLNQSSNINPSNLFSSNQIVNGSKYVVVPSNESLYLIDLNNGSIFKKFDFSIEIKPLIIDNYLFLVTKNNLLISLELKTGEIIFSYDIKSHLSKFLNIDKKKIEYKNLLILNNSIFIFLKDNYLLQYSIKGQFKDFYKLPSRIHSQPILIDNFIIYLGNKNKIFIYG